MVWIGARVFLFNHPNQYFFRQAREPRTILLRGWIASNPKKNCRRTFGGMFAGKYWNIGHKRRSRTKSMGIPNRHMWRNCGGRPIIDGPLHFGTHCRKTRAFYLLWAQTVLPIQWFRVPRQFQHGCNAESRWDSGDFEMHAQVGIETQRTFGNLRQRQPESINWKTWDVFHGRIHIWMRNAKYIGAYSKWGRKKWMWILRRPKTRRQYESVFSDIRNFQNMLSLVFHLCFIHFYFINS